MIKNFSDHAANERTFLSWVRTAIAVIAFGFVVERFDLFLSLMAPSVLRGKITLGQSEFGRIAGVVLIVLGMVMILVSTFRFVRTAKEIDEPTVFPGTGSRVDVALAALLVLLAGGLLIYLAHSLGARA